MLEGSRGVALTKQHDHGFEESKGHFECGFPLISIFDMDIMVSLSNIKFGEEALSGQISCE